MCDGVHAVGWVQDDAADGRCPFVRFWMSDGQTRISNWAGPKGDYSPIDVWAPPGTTIINYYLDSISC
ncbi:hypothetical protein ACWCXX_26500 [Streptomyces sp. NPDC001732]